MIRKAALPLIPLLLLLAALACGGTTTPPGPTPGSLPPAGEIAPPPLDAGAMGEHSGPIRLGDGLENLAQYRLSLQIRFGSGDAEQSIVVVSDRRHSPQTSHSIVQIVDGNQPGGMEEVLLVEQDGLLYIVEVDIGCLIQSGSANDPALNPFAAILDPDRLVGEIQGAKLVGDVELPRGVLAAQYQFNEAALVEQSGLAGLTGNAYLDRNLGVVLALTAVASQGALREFESAPSGGFQLNYELIPDYATVIEIPPACPNLRAHEPYPLLDDAYEISFADNTLIYKSAYGLAETLNFYQAAMGAAGWVSDEAEDYVTETAVIISYQRGSENVALSLIEENGGQGTVVIVGP